MTQATDSFEEIKSAVVRFAGDSGDGMQTIGERFTDSSAFAGNDIATLPDFPAEIRAPPAPLLVCLGTNSNLEAPQYSLLGMNRMLWWR